MSEAIHLAEVVKDIVHADRDHALLAPSAGKRWTHCFASPWMIKQLGDAPQETNASMLYGTKGHEWSEILGRHLLLENNIIAYKNKLEEYRVYCASEIAAEKKEQDLSYYVQQYVSWCRNLWDEILRVRKPKSTKVFIELKVQMYAETSGTADFVLLCENQDGTWDIIVADLKLGKGVKVDAENNEQIELYLIGVIKSVLPPGAILNKGHCFIYQPRINPEDPWKKSKLTPAEVEAKDAKYNTAHDKCLKILQDGPTKEDFEVGDWCRFCPAYPTCKIYRMSTSNSVGFLLEEENSLEAHVVPLDRVIAAVKAKKSIERFLSECEHHLMVMLQQGKEVPGYKLVASRSQRKWDVEKKAEIVDFLKKQGCANPLEEPKLIGITKAKQYTSDDGMKPYVTMTVPKLQLAALDDKRPAVEITNAQNLMLDEGSDD